MQMATKNPLPQDLGAYRGCRARWYGFRGDDGFAAKHEQPPLPANTAAVQLAVPLSFGPENQDVFWHLLGRGQAYRKRFDATFPARRVGYSVVREQRTRS